MHTHGHVSMSAQQHHAAKAHESHALMRSKHIASGAATLKALKSMLEMQTDLGSEDDGGVAEVCVAAEETCWTSDGSGGASVLA